jgi:galactoside O-acetyltransferase
LKKFINKYYQRIRIKIFHFLSSSDIRIEGMPSKIQPVQYVGKGTVHFDSGVVLGVFASPYFFEGSVYIEARDINSEIIFGKNISSNNNLKIICDKSKIEIGDNVLLGYNVHMIDSDFHGILPDQRLSDDYKFAPICIKKNVFIGSDVTILKGVTIGENSVVANGSVVTKSFPENVIIAGNPARIIKNIDEYL